MFHLAQQRRVISVHLGRKLKCQTQRGFTLVEVMVTMVLLTILIVTSAASLLTCYQVSHRLGDYTAAMAVVEAKVHDIRAATYNPPNYPFGPSTVYVTNTDSIALDNAGATFLVPGTVVSTIEPTASGHLVTVTGTFNIPGKPVSVTLQSLVNKYSGGQQ